MGLADVYGSNWASESDIRSNLAGGSAVEAVEAVVLTVVQKFVHAVISSLLGAAPNFPPYVILTEGTYQSVTPILTQQIFLYSLSVFRDVLSLWSNACKIKSLHGSTPGSTDSLRKAFHLVGSVLNVLTYFSSAYFVNNPNS